MTGRRRALGAVGAAVIVVAALIGAFSTTVNRSAAAWTASVANQGNTFTTSASWGQPMYSWGAYNTGGTGVLLSTAYSYTAVRATGPMAWSSVASGHESTCALTTDASLYCWGYNGYGQLGDGTTTDLHEPTPIASGTTWSSVAKGHVDTCAIRSTDRTLWCWGYNPNGQVGNSSTASPVKTPTAVTTVGTGTWSSVTVGEYFACGIQTDGTLWCWGYNDAGQLGQGDTTTRTTPTQVGSATTWRSISAAWTSICGTQTDDTLWCWGNRALGQVGDGSTSPDQTTPKQIATGYSVTAGGVDRHCGLTTTGTIFCWGYGGSGGLGNGGTADSSTPVQEASGSTAWTAIASAAYTSCAKKAPGELYCWGYNSHGQVGDGTATNRTSPVASGSATDWTAIDGGYDHVCGIRSGDSSLWCWGNNAYQKLGQWNAIQVGSPTPVMTGSTSHTDFLTGEVDTDGGCGVTAAGTLWCWGSNTAGLAGVGDTTNHYFPVQESNGWTDWSSISVGRRTACGLRGGGSLYCWGDGGSNQLGTGSTSDVHVPTAGPAGTWSQVSVGWEHTCGIKSGGTLLCWGTGTWGELGQGDTADHSTPVQVTAAGVTSWSLVDAGYVETCAIAATGSAAGHLFCWGMNTYGEVGTGGTGGNVTSPYQTGAGTWTSVSVGWGTVCGVTSGALYCWGYNDQGQVGNGGTATTSSPAHIGAATTWSDVAVARSFSCATRTDKTLWCWGRDDGGQLGDLGTTGQVSSPQQVRGTTATWVAGHDYALTMLAGGPG